MNGDNPAFEMEDGTQHGGHFGCVGCDGNINRNYHLAYTFQRRYRTLLEKQDLIKSAPAGRKLGLHPFKNMKINELNNELAARGLSTEGSRQELQSAWGSTRIPVLLHGNECVSVNDLNLQSYEVLCFEALHCSMNHIKNVLQELPHHITDIDTLIKFKEILNIQLSKEKIRGVD